MMRNPSASTLFPYTTLFRSLLHRVVGLVGEDDVLRRSWKRREAGAGRALVEVCEAFAVDLLEAPYRAGELDRKSTRLNSSHVEISYAVFCLKKKTMD